MATCRTPVTFKNPAFGKKAGQALMITVPCGKCLNCVQNRRMMWSVRLQEERRISSSSYFITLTYDNETVPVDGVRVKDVQDYIKRLRKNLQSLGLDKAYKIKYFGCAEYGSKTLRPHYHLILFNYPSDFEEDIITSWKKGHVHMVDNVGDQSLMYITKYMYGAAFDKVNDLDDSDVPAIPGQIVSKDGVLLNEPFAVMSTGLGRSYVERMKKWHQSDEERFYYPKEGYRITLPRYYRERIYTQAQTERYKQRLEEMRLQRQVPSRDEQILEVLRVNDESRRRRKNVVEFRSREKL